MSARFEASCHLFTFLSHRDISVDCTWVYRGLRVNNLTAIINASVMLSAALILFQVNVGQRTFKSEAISITQFHFFFSIPYRDGSFQSSHIRKGASFGNSLF